MPNIAFDHPWILLALALAIPCAWMSWRSIPVLSLASAVVGFILRLGVLVLLVVAIARPIMGWTSNATSVIVAIDSSASVPSALRARAESDIAVAAVARREGDRLGLVTFARRANIAALPSTEPMDSIPGHPGDRDGSNLADAVRMAIAIAPGDTASRILLVSDGNATDGNAAEAADLARAAGIPVDVVPLRYSHEREAVVERVAAPSRARKGQSVDLRVSIRSVGELTGRLEVRHNGEPVDLDPASDANGMRVLLEPGANLVTIPVISGGAGTQRYEVLFVPDDSGSDAVPENNRGVATVFVGGTGRIAIVRPEGSEESEPLAESLGRGQIEVETVSPERAMAGGLEWLVGFDAVVLANVPRWSVDNAFDRALHAYCHDAGGGLLMLGGPESFGAGGWNGSEVERALPLRMDPPQTRMLLRAAVALVIDASGSMSSTVAAAGRTQQEVANGAAIVGLRSLSRLDEAVVVAFSGKPDLVVPRGPIADGREMARAIAGIQPGGGTNLFPAMELAVEQLHGSRARTKHILILSDGQTSGDEADGLEIARRARASGMTVSAIGIGDASNSGLLQGIARSGGGRFHAIDSDTSARKLPQVFVRELSLEGRALVQEGDYRPVVLRGLGGPLQGIDALPALRGYVVTAAGEGTSQQGASIRVREGADPLLAWQNYGVGRAAAFTADLGGRWGAAWKQWPGFQAFSEQLLRWAMRPADDRSLNTAVTVDGERATLRISSPQEDTGFAPALRLDARLADPEGRVTPLPVRQIGPGSFEATFDARQVGPYLVSIASARASASGAVRTSTAHVSVAVPYATEYRAVRDDASTLRQIADRSGGRVIELDQLQLVDLFDRAGLAPARGSLALWDLLAMAAAALTVLDVAWRRIAFSRGDAANLVARVTGGAAGAPADPPTSVASITAASLGAGATVSGEPIDPSKPYSDGKSSLSRLRVARARSGAQQPRP